MGWPRLSHTANGVPDSKATIPHMNTQRRFLQWATTVLVAFVAFALPAHAASATVPPPSPAPVTSDPAQQEIVESWALSPAGSLDPTQAGNRPELSYVTDPGAVIEDAVTLYNYGNVQLTFRVYATDAFNSADGSFSLLPGADKPKAAGSWVFVSQENVTVPPRKQVTIPITIKIPADVAPGDHPGAVVASNSVESNNTTGPVVNLDRRTGTRMYIRVNGPLTPELAVADVVTDYHQALNPLSGSATVTYRVENRGNVRMSGKATGKITGPFGLASRSIKLPDIPELLPGGKVTVTAEVKDVPALFVAFTTIEVKPTGGGDVGKATASSGTDLTFAPPLALLLVLLSLLFGLLGWRAFRRHQDNAAAQLDADAEQLDDQQHGQHPEHEPQHQPS